MPYHLLIVPNVWGVESTVAMRDAGAIVLDELLEVGFAGVFFRRLRIEAVMGVSKRVVYDGIRHKYLRAVLESYAGVSGDALFVGTHPSDADLLEYESVRAVKFPDSTLRDLSKSVYGDGLMLPVEYAAVLESMSGSVDEWDAVRSWVDLSLLILQVFPVVDPNGLQVAGSVQRKILQGVSEEENLSGVWMEDEIRLDFPSGKGFLLADYDYLGAVKPVWRDAVVRCLGRAPSIERVFRLPWFVVDVQAFGTLCFRADINGLPAVSMRGDSLVTFVRTRLSSVFTSRELVGTWIGSLLSDDVMAVETAATLATDPLVPAGEAGVRSTAVADDECLLVPAEYAWMYEAVIGVKVAEWSGVRAVDGKPVVGALAEGWARTLSVAELFQSYRKDPLVATAVVELMYRLHQVSVPGLVVRRVQDMAFRVYVDDSGFDPGDEPYMALLPGYAYLARVPVDVRMLVARLLGRFPGRGDLVRLVESEARVSGVYFTELWAEVSRQALLSGVPVVRGLTSSSGLTGGIQRKSAELLPGLCYLAMFQKGYWPVVQAALGYYPSLKDVVGVSEVYRLADWPSQIYVKLGPEHLSVPRSLTYDLAHFTREPDGPLLSEYLDETLEETALARVRVGAPWLDKDVDVTAVLQQFSAVGGVESLSVVLRFLDAYPSWKLVTDRATAVGLCAARAVASGSGHSELQSYFECWATACQVAGNVIDAGRAGRYVATSGPVSFLRD